MFNIGLVSISVAASVCVLNFHFRGHRQSKVPKWLKRLLFIDSSKNKNLKELYLVQEQQINSNKIKLNRHLFDTNNNLNDGSKNKYHSFNHVENQKLSHKCNEKNFIYLNGQDKMIHYFERDKNNNNSFPKSQSNGNIKMNKVYLG